jgi:hypothetical protein
MEPEDYYHVYKSPSTASSPVPGEANQNLLTQLP